MTIFIDSRVGSKDLINIPPLDTPGLCELSRLNSADIMFSGYGPSGDTLIGVELKSLPDLISSIQTGRLQAEQMPKMIRDYDTRWILYYGNYRPGQNGALQINKGGGWKDYGYGEKPILYSYLEDFLIEAREYGFNIQRVGSERRYEKEEAVKWIYTYYKLISRPWKTHKIFKTFDNSAQIPFPPGMSLTAHEKRMARVVDKLCQGIGFERSIAVARHFKSHSHMTAASVDEWKGIDGIGAVIAKKVYTEIRREK